MPEEVKRLIQEYQEGRITRREFMQRAMVFTGSLAVAASLVDSIVPSSSHAAQLVDPNDPALVSTDVQYTGNAGPVFGYLTRPQAAGKYPAIIIVHGGSGLDDHVRDVARRLAKEGYVALALDFLSRHGGTQKVMSAGKRISIRQMAPWQAVAEDTERGFAYLHGLPYVRGDRLGIIGFCWGGEMTFALATQVRGLKAVVVYYGRSPNPLDRVKNIEAPVLAHYGGEDKGVNRGIPTTEEAMKQYNKSYTYTIYPGATHGFNSDIGESGSNAAAAQEAWVKTLEFFKAHLQS
jgi:carboxymethylenebutenolidase